MGGETSTPAQWPRRRAGEGRPLITAGSAGSRSRGTESDTIEESTRTETSDSEYGSLGRWERSCALILGSVSLGAGSAAVFISDNGAGTSVLLIVAAAMLLIGIQGTPLIRVGGDAASFELARRRSEAEHIIRTAELDNLETARDVIEAVAKIEPSVQVQATVAARQIYHEEVIAAVQRVVQPRALTLVRDDVVDAVFSLDSGDDPMDLVIEYATGNPSVGFLRELSREISPRRLIVTNINLSEGLVRHFPELAAVTTWQGPEDDVNLTEAVGRILHTPSRSTP